MAKSKAVETLLATAIALAGTVENLELKTAIDELEALEDATHSNSEYKALKDLVEQIEDGGAGDEDAEAKAKAEKEAQEKLDAEKKAKADAEAQKKPIKSAIKYAGVKQIGAKWYCKKDNYKKGFATADECAEHFNG